MSQLPSFGNVFVNITSPPPWQLRKVEYSPTDVSPSSSGMWWSIPTVFRGIEWIHEEIS